MKRDIVVINEELCNGCGACIPNCHEGALAIIDGKARLVSDPMCDGLGACIGHCPQGAISIIQREAAPYNETPSHGECHSGGCPGSAEHVFAVRKPAVAYSGELPSELSHWPIQLHLINPSGGHFRESNLVIAADSTAFTYRNFHGKYLKRQTLVIACPKLDQALDRYKEYGLNIALLNRFTSNKESERIFKDLSTGKIDIVFGTHRLLNEKIKLYNTLIHTFIIINKCC